MLTCGCCMPLFCSDTFASQVKYQVGSGSRVLSQRMSYRGSRRAAPAGKRPQAASQYLPQSQTSSSMVPSPKQTRITAGRRRRTSPAQRELVKMKTKMLLNSTAMAAG